MADVYPDVTEVLAGVEFGPDGAHVTGTLTLASQASVDVIDGLVDAIKAKTDGLTFTTPNKVDATAAGISITLGSGLTFGRIYMDGPKRGRIVIL